MRFSVDLDGVLANFTDSAKDVINSIWPGRIPDNFEVGDWYWTQYMKKEDWGPVFAEIKKRRSFWFREQELPGLRELRDNLFLFDEVYFVTARVQSEGEPTSVQSAQWLTWRGLYPRAGYSTVIQVEEPNLKCLVFAALKLKYHLDDYAPAVEQMNAEVEGMRAFLLDQPWNRYATHLPRVYSVEEYLDTIRAL